MGKRKSDVFLWLVALQSCALLFLAFHGSWFRERAIPMLAERRETVRYYQITDLSLFTEARYTRHPSMADMNTAFQDHPLSLDHFPSGSLVMPPGHLRKHGLD